MRPRPSRAAGPLLWAALLVAAGPGEVRAQGGGSEPLHEYIDLGPGEDLLEPAITLAVGAPAPAPASLPPSRPGSPAGGEPGPGGGGGVATGNDINPDTLPELDIDRDTSRPPPTPYEDLFTPSIAPFKRLLVYDQVDARGRFSIASRELVPVPRAAPGVGAEDEHFHASLHVELRAGEPVPIASVAPGARWVVAHGEPPARLTLLHDSADNWYVRSNRDGPAQLTLQVAVQRRVFGSPLRDASWAELRPRLPAVPAEVVAAARGIASALGLPVGARPRAVVSHLVQHFRRFRSSETPARGLGLGLYRELALGGRGICRHRAYAFTVTGLGLGVPTRYVLNEAHAWVEVFDGQLWHRIDLGGAASEVSREDSQRPTHVEPGDPFDWPRGADSAAEALAAGARSARQPQEGEPDGPQSPGDGPASGDPAAYEGALGQGLGDPPPPGALSELAGRSGAGASAAAGAPPNQSTAASGPPGGDPAAIEPSLRSSSSDPDAPSLAEPEPSAEPRAASAASDRPIPPPGASPGAAPASSTQPAGTDAEPAPGATRTPPPRQPRVRLRVEAQQSLRGQAVEITGRARLDGAPCANAPLRIRLVPGRASGISAGASPEPAGGVDIGTLVSDGQGRLRGRLVIPYDAPLGSHSVEASLDPSGTGCAAR